MAQVLGGLALHGCSVALWGGLGFNLGLEGKAWQAAQPHEPFSRCASARAQRDAAAAGKGSFAWAWMLDERPEERARGVTVDVAVTRWVLLWSCSVLFCAFVLFMSRAQLAMPLSQPGSPRGLARAPLPPLPLPLLPAGLRRRGAT